LGIAAVRANARMRLRVLSLLSKGGTSVPVAVRQTKTGITKKQNEKITVAMALGAARLSLRIQ
jgi:Flp pilus assembly protein CpaB